MDDKNLNIENNNIYRAMPNMNTAIENPDVSMTGVMDVNIKDVDSDLGINNLNSQINIGNSIINNEMQMSNVSNNQEIYGQSSIYINNIEQNNNIGNSQIENKYIDGNNQTNNFIDQTLQQNGFISGEQEEKKIVVSNNNVGIQENSSNIKEVYKPAFNSKTKPKKGLVISKELVVLIIIVGILLLFLFIMPYIYDFFRTLDFDIIF